MEVEINGVISGEYSSEEIVDMFLEWCESKNLMFGGGFDTSDNS